jgi:nucleoside-diphosphate-sugar epimerase
MAVGEYAGIAKAAACSESKLLFGAAEPRGTLKTEEFSIERLRNDAGYEPKIEFADGVREMVASMRSVFP